MSEYAIGAYKSRGRGVLFIDCNQLMEYIVPGFNIPVIYYYKEENVKQSLDYNPEKTYHVIFDRYTNGEVTIWRRELKIGDEETLSKKFELLYSLTETNAQNQEMDSSPKEIH